jgi:nucleotide-binding universal stress UspA family protein
MASIVVGIDGSDHSKEALGWAAQQARLTAAELHVVAARPDATDSVETLRRGLEDLVTEVLGTSPGVPLRVDVLTSHPGPGLVEAAGGADLLVVGSRGHATLAGKLHLGSVGLHCATHAPCSVVVHRQRPVETPPTEATLTDRIVVAIDGSDASIGAALWAGHQAVLTASTVELVAAWHWPAFSGSEPASPDGDYDPEGDAQRTLDDVAPRVGAASPGVEVLCTRIYGPPGRSVVQVARQSALLVVGNRGHGEVVGKLLGSVSEHCVAKADCSVLVFRG